MTNKVSVAMKEWLYPNKIGIKVTIDENYIIFTKYIDDAFDTISTIKTEQFKTAGNEFIANVGQKFNVELDCVEISNFLYYSGVGTW